MSFKDNANIKRKTTFFHFLLLCFKPLQWILIHVAYSSEKSPDEVFLNAGSDDMCEINILLFCCVYNPEQAAKAAGTIVLFLSEKLYFTHKYVKSTTSEKEKRKVFIFKPRYSVTASSTLWQTRNVQTSE